MDTFIDLDFVSKTGEGLLSGRLYMPASIARHNSLPETGLLVQIVHGLAEHMDRYDDFCRYLVGQGLAVCLYDLPGHGRSALRSGKTGHFGFDDGSRLVLEDLDVFAGLAIANLQERTPVKSWKRLLFGHSMGSFIVRAYQAGQPVQPVDGVIYSGTIGSSLSYQLGYWLAKRSVRKNGPLYPDRFIQKLGFAKYLSHIQNPRTPFDWLSRDADVVDRYMSDPLCGFPLTASGFRDFFIWLIDISKKGWVSKIPKNLPILVISGSECPVGNFGKGPSEVYRKLKRSGHRAELKILEGDRHETLNEINRGEVRQILLDWINGNVLLKPDTGRI
jgi:alpha-beta hydrolase superfamily lysophospholipase